MIVIFLKFLFLCLKRPFGLLAPGTKSHWLEELSAFHRGVKALTLLVYCAAYADSLLRTYTDNQILLVICPETLAAVTARVFLGGCVGNSAVCKQ